MDKAREEVLAILMRRDSLDRTEAVDILDDCMEQIQEALDADESFDYITDLFASEVGLEPDYLIGLL